MRQETNDFAVRTPKRLARGLDQLFRVAAIDIHDIETANGFASLPLIHGKADFGAVGRDLRIVLVLVGCAREVHCAGTVGVHREDFPVVIDVAFVGDLERQSFQCFVKRNRLTGCDASDRSQEDERDHERASKER